MKNDDEEVEEFLGKPGGDKEAESEANVRKMKRYFMKKEVEPLLDPRPIDLRKAPGPESVDEGEPTEVTAESVEEYYNLCEQIRNLEAVKEEMRGRLLHNMRGDEQALVGKFAIFVKTKTRTTVEWDKYVKDQMGDAGLAEARKLYGTEKEFTTLEIKRVGK